MCFKLGISFCYIFNFTLLKVRDKILGSESTLALRVMYASVALRVMYASDSDT
jgi:hypothetical protein